MALLQAPQQLWTPVSVRLLTLPLVDAAVAREVHRLGFELAVEAGRGQGLDALLGRGVIGRREGHGPGLLVANTLDPLDILQRLAHALDASRAAEMNVLDLDLGLGQRGRTQHAGRAQ